MVHYRPLDTSRKEIRRGVQDISRTGRSREVACQSSSVVGSAFIKQLGKDAPPSASPGFPESPVYQQDIFCNATIFNGATFTSYHVNGVAPVIPTKSLWTADVIERNYQVGRMQQIYSTAIKVLIMTGPGVEDPQATCELLGRSFRATLQGYASPEDTRIFLNEDAIHVTPDYRLPPSEVH
ncbi:hypothetical protein CHU98_g4988 [Xylaria longipes]|nr:hypothetical protein CHU98_g4988 [Xylaria longipes]